MVTMVRAGEPNPDNAAAEGRPIREVRLEGYRRTREYIITRELETRPGKIFRQEVAEEDLRRLERLDIFALAAVETAVERDSVVVVFNLVESLPVLPTVAVRISDETGISAGGGVKLPNLTGKDIMLSARLLVGGATEAELWLENPWAWGDHVGYKFEYYHRDKDNEVADFKEKADEFYLYVSGNLSEKWKLGGTLSFLSIKGDRDDVTLSPGARDEVLAPGCYLNYDNVDAFIDPSRGWFLQADYSYHKGLADNPCRFNQLDLDARRYIHLLPRHKLALFNLTTLRTGGMGKDVAPWQQFGIGGTNTVRGWSFAARRGKNQCLNTLEYRFTLMPTRYLELPLGIKYRGGLQLALFGDGGIGWDDAPQFAADNFIWGYGFGFRLLLPIVSMARIDFAWGEDDEGVFLHLGSFEKSVMARRRVR